MIPFGFFASGGTGSLPEPADPALALPSLLGAFDARDVATISATGGVLAGNPVDSWAPVAGSHGVPLAQTGGTRPLVDLTQAAGLPALRFHGGRNLQQTAPGAAVATFVALVWVPAGSVVNAQVVVSRDTSAVSTSPAYEVRAG